MIRSNLGSKIDLVICIMKTLAQLFEEATHAPEFKLETARLAFTDVLLEVIEELGHKRTAQLIGLQEDELIKLIDG